MILKIILRRQAYFSLLESCRAGNFPVLHNIPSVKYNNCSYDYNTASIHHYILMAQ
jgi:hypothetical protein